MPFKFLKIIFLRKTFNFAVIYIQKMAVSFFFFGCIAGYAFFKKQITPLLLLYKNLAIYI